MKHYKMSKIGSFGGIVTPTFYHKQLTGRKPFSLINFKEAFNFTESGVRMCTQRSA